MRAAILALLKEGPRNGYQIMSEIAERSGGAWRPSPGAVYPALSQLADEGLIVGEEEDGRRTFSLTDAGREYVAEHPERARGAWESAEQQQAWEVPGLFAEAARLGGGIVQLAHAGTHEQIAAAERLLAQTRRDLYRILADDDEPETAESETGEPQTDAPKTAASQTDAPGTAASQTGAPQATAETQTGASQTNAPETDASQTDAPQADASQTDVPQTGETETGEQEN